MLQAQVDIAEQRVADTVHRAPVMSHAADAAASGPVGDQANAHEASGFDAGGSAAADARDSSDTAGSGAARGGGTYEVAQRMVTVGDYVQIGAPLMRVVDADPLKLRVPVPERRLGAIHKGQPVTVAVEAFDRKFEGRVSRVSPAVDTATRTFAVEVLVDNPDGALKPGSFATAEVEVGREEATVVPEKTVVTFAGVHKVLRVLDGKIEERRVELGDRSEGTVEVRNGVAAGDVLVVNPPASLTTGTPVTVSTKPAGGEPTASADAHAEHDEANTKP
jgi:multidrug efflux pump subunit AcrA (membrane-fusion protein)